MLPISYGDAQPLLAALTGASGARGAGAARCPLPITSAPARQGSPESQFNWDIKPVYDVIAKIPEPTIPDEWIVRGNHHDAWVNGAEDPVSGPWFVMEEARASASSPSRDGSRSARLFIACGTAKNRGCSARPNGRETHADELEQHAVAYINSDGNGSRLSVHGWIPSLERFINGVARDIKIRKRRSPSGNGTS